MLGEHVRFLAKVNMAASEKLKNRLIEAIRSLATMPERYPFLEEEHIPSNKYHKLFVEKWFLILYQIRDDTVYVDYVVDCRQDYRFLL